MFLHRQLPHHCVQTRKRRAAMSVDFTGLVKAIKHTSYNSGDCFSFPRPPFSLSLVSYTEPQRSLSVPVVLHVFYFSCKLYILSIIGDHCRHPSCLTYILLFPSQDTHNLSFLNIPVLSYNRRCGRCFVLESTESTFYWNCSLSTAGSHNNGWLAEVVFYQKGHKSFQVWGRKGFKYSSRSHLLKN